MATLRHLTLTGFHAGKTLCGQPRGSEQVHAVYAPLHREEFRADTCKDCLREYALSFELDELPGAPEWVRKIHGVEKASQQDNTNKEPQHG